MSQKEGNGETKARVTVRTLAGVCRPVAVAHVTPNEGNDTSQLPRRAATVAPGLWGWVNTGLKNSEESETAVRTEKSGSSQTPNMIETMGE
ncbi:hypothetical protein D4764_03G0001560 [Takifugu flavidus]|uniref:Uncharacterized protein n=1 Tax=Takifugu flavidus TaxID=433684 RepID=A0A5C6N8P0_9TELE|nr:hypothetical protein D4764_03G0001560 [Takifugu flavidus]